MGRLFSYFRPEEQANTSSVTTDTIHPNLTLNDATSFILEKVSPAYQSMLASNFSVRLRLSLSFQDDLC